MSRKRLAGLISGFLLLSSGVFSAESSEGILLKDLESYLRGLQSSIERLEKKVEKLSEETRALKKEVAELKSQLKKASGVTEGAAKGKKARLGLLIQEKESNAGTQLLVEEVEEGFAGAACGLKKGDLILKVNGREVKTFQGLEQALGPFEEGAKVEIVFRTPEGKLFRAIVRASGRRNEAECLLKEEIKAKGAERERQESALPAAGKAGLGIVFAEEGGKVVVVAVLRDSAAEKAGVQPGDVLLEVDGKKIRSLSELRSTLRNRKENRVRLRLKDEQGKEKQVTLSFGEAQEKIEPPKEKASQRPYLGIEVVYEGDRVEVSKVLANGPCSGKLQAGDIITRLGSYQIRSLQDLRKAVSKLRVGQEVVIAVLRDGEEVEVKVVPSSRPER